jgi:hypothetical protein
MSDVKVEVAEFTDKTGKVTEYHYISKADYDALVAELAGLRREHQRVWDEKKALESQLRAIDIACQSVSAENEALKAALRSIAANTCCDRCQEAALVAQAALRATAGEASQTEGGGET